MTTELNELLGELAEAPDGQIAIDQVGKIKQLIGKPAKEIEAGLKQILEDCCTYSLASDFAMVMLDMAWEQAKELGNQT